jgi:hypothetical protein
MVSRSFKPEKYGMAFCFECRGSGKSIDEKGPCQRCGGFGLLIWNKNPCSTILWGAPALLRWEASSHEDRRVEEKKCDHCREDCNYELVKCLPGRKYRVKCRVCGCVFVIDRPKSEIPAIAPKC